MAPTSYESFYANNEEFPKRIYQTWKSKTVIPANMKHWMNTWVDNNTGYKHELWDDRDNRVFMKRYYSWFLPVYDSYDKNINRVDAVRYFYLFHYGGIYVDMDFECLKPVDNLLKQNKDYDILFGSIESDGKYVGHSIPNAIMISKPQQAFWVVVFYFLITNKSLGSVEEQTGPIMLKMAFDFYRRNQAVLDTYTWYNELRSYIDKVISKTSNIKVFNPEVLYPLSWITNQELRSDTLSQSTENYKELTKRMVAKFPNSYAITYWTHTW
jgi:mannosyltransferase OCH1-like enzyme